MILAKARLIANLNGLVRVGLSFPTGFDPEEVVPESVMGNGVAAGDGVHVPPRDGGVVDLFRELEVSFPLDVLSQSGSESTALKITGRLRRGLEFTASVGQPKQPHSRRADH